MQDRSSAHSALRAREQLESLAEAITEASNAETANPLSFDKHLFSERRPLIVVDPSHITPTPLHLTQGITVWLLRLEIEAVYFDGGLTRAEVLATDLARVLRYGPGVKSAPYIGC